MPTRHRDVRRSRSGTPCSAVRGGSDEEGRQRQAQDRPYGAAARRRTALASSWPKRSRTPGPGRSRRDVDRGTTSPRTANRRAFRRSWGRSQPSWGFPRKSNGDDYRGKSEEQTGQCLLKRKQVHLATPDEQWSAQDVEDARHPQSRRCPNQGNRQKHRTDEPQQDRETGGSHEGGTIRGIGVQCLCRRCLTPQVGTSDARLNGSRATKRRRQIDLRYDGDDRPDQRGTAETTAATKTNTEPRQESPARLRRCSRPGG
jgi:hypothetical protein